MTSVDVEDPTDMTTNDTEDTADVQTHQVMLQS
jgi:hypothetical protein